MTKERKEEIFNELINYVSEHCVDENDFYHALTHIIGLSDEEIEELNIDVEFTNEMSNLGELIEEM